MEPGTTELIGDGVDSVHIWHANLVCVLSTLSFYCIGEVLTRFGKPTSVSADVEFWKWRNIVISWIHGIVCGLWDLLCIVWYPDLFRDPVAYINNFSYLMVPFSAGYFIYDFIDLMLNKKLRVHWELTLHHTIITTSFVYNWVVKTCIGYTVLALMAEINSIFLHLRKLLQMCKVGFNTKLYRSVSFINLFTFVTCRLIPQVRLYAGFYYDFYRITTTYFMFFTLTVFTGVVINIILFWRLVKTDILKPYMGYGKKKNSDEEQNVISNGYDNSNYSKDE